MHFVISSSFPIMLISVFVARPRVKNRSFEWVDVCGLYFRIREYFLIEHTTHTHTKAMEWEGPNKIHAVHGLVCVSEHLEIVWLFFFDFELSNSLVFINCQISDKNGSIQIEFTSFWIWYGNPENKKNKINFIDSQNTSKSYNYIFFSSNGAWHNQIHTHTHTLTTYII